VRRRKIGLFLMVCLGVFASVGAVRAQSAGEVSITAFGGKADDLSDTTPAVAAALQACRKQGAKKLTFTPGRYDFYPALAGQRQLFVSNNDPGMRRIVFDLKGFKDLEIDGKGARFIFHDFLCPFVVENSGGITLDHFSVDFARTFHSEGKIVAVNAGGMELQFSPDFPYVIRDGKLVFINGSKDQNPQGTAGWEEVTYPYKSLLEFDPNKRETAFMANDISALGITAEQLPSGDVEIHPGIAGTPGNVMVFGAEHRDAPGFVISDSSDVSLLNIDLYHCGAMGVIAQRSRNITIQKMRVTPTPGSGRVLSVTADATHFDNCSGKIVLKDCLFECQKDDATNIHGTYVQVTRKLAPDTIEVKLMRPDQAGTHYIVPGMKLELVHGSSLETYGEATVQSVDILDDESSRVTLTAPFPSKLTQGDVVASLDEQPDVVISGCTIRGNRARGILLGSHGKILVEGNTFHTAGSAILLEGDGDFWFEQAGVRDLTIRGNTFDNCNYGVWGTGVISVGAGIAEKDRAHSRYNKNILIEKNIFRQFDSSPILHMYSVSGLTYRDNTQERTNAYPSRRGSGKRFDITDSDNVTIDSGDGEELR
jgi:hypothetical protein